MCLFKVNKLRSDTLFETLSTDVRKPSPIQNAAMKTGDTIFKPLESDAHPGDADNETREPTPDIQQHTSKAAEAVFSEKDRTTKRRKTLFKDQISIMDHEIEVKITDLEEKATLAGKNPAPRLPLKPHVTSSPGSYRCEAGSASGHP